uniref:DUF3492 domain-containing protein n=1 Tax=Fervidobacterium thailandense TaxID=1008305 RepID=A0A7C4GLB9_9BACT
MKVCVIVEGTYPYVTGGVSNWLQMLMENMPDVEFEVVHLAPWRWMRSFAYKLPSNVQRVYEYPLFSADFETVDFSIDLDGIFIKIRELVDYKIRRCELFLELLKDVAGKKLDFILKTKEFWRFLTDVYSRYFSKEGFTRFYWTVVGFMVPILSAIQSLPPRADIYHSTTTGYAVLSAMAGKFYHGGKLIVTEHGIYHREREIEITKSKSIDEIYKPVWIEIFKLISKAAYTSCDALTTLFEKNQLFQLELEADFRKMRIIPNGVNVDKFSAIQREPHETFNIGIVGRVVPIKDIITAIKAFDLVVKQIPNARLYIIGPRDEDEEYYEKCVGLVELFGLADKVNFTGKANVLDYYKIIDVLLISSISEGQPLVQLEAMASGIPVVATNVGNCAEIALDPDGQSGFIVEPKDYNAMAEKLIELAKNEEVYKFFSENGKRIAREKYNLKTMVESYKKLYQEVLNYEEL